MTLRSWRKVGTPMNTSPKLRPGLWDALVVLVVAALAVSCGWTVWDGQDRGTELTAVVSVDGAETERLPLKEAAGTERTIHAGGYTLRLRLTETEIWVESADCPTQDCVHTGHISRGGQSIVCLPARVIIQLEGGERVDTGVDAVIG